MSALSDSVINFMRHVSSANIYK